MEFLKEFQMGLMAKLQQLQKCSDQKCGNGGGVGIIINHLRDGKKEGYLNGHPIFPEQGHNSEGEVDGVYDIDIGHDDYYPEVEVEENEFEENLQEDLSNEENESDSADEIVETKSQIEKRKHNQRKVTKHTLRF